jgi:hypothetical protein
MIMFLSLLVFSSLCFLSKAKRPAADIDHFGPRCVKVTIVIIWLQNLRIGDNPVTRKRITGHSPSTNAVIALAKETEEFPQDPHSQFKLSGRPVAPFIEITAPGNSQAS